MANVSATALFLAVDGNGSVYVSQGTSIIKITNGVVSTFASGFVNAGSLAFDRSGNLFVIDNGGTIVRVFPDGTKFPFATLLKGASFLAFDRSGNLFTTANPLGSGSGVIYKFSSTGDRSTFASGLTNVEGLAFDAAGTLFVAETGTQSGSKNHFYCCRVRATPPGFRCGRQSFCHKRNRYHLESHAGRNGKHFQRSELSGRTSFRATIKPAA